MSFKPAAFFLSLESFGTSIDVTVTGTVVYVNREHRLCRVEYPTPTPGCIGHECFKF